MIDRKLTLHLVPESVVPTRVRGLLLSGATQLNITRSQPHHFTIQATFPKTASHERQATNKLE